MSKSRLAIILSKLKRIPDPDVDMEQYPTPSEAAAAILWDAHMRGLIEGKRILDLGAGTGILGIGALLLGASHVTFVEKDERLKKLIRENLKIADAEEGSYDIVIGDATKYEGSADLVLTNPPFGTKEPGADLRFLETAYEAAPECYSFHKTSTDNHLREWLVKRKLHPLQGIRFTFNLPNTMRFHGKKAHHVQVTCWHARKDL
ncbi:MAG: METTL5 family protein [Candidatus Woesearchaeota archaeon]